MSKLKTFFRIIKGIGFCFMCAFDREFIAEARAEQAQEKWERENGVLAYAKVKK
jgi:hypothetical protein